MLCGGHGDYVNGECECHPGWKGRECSLRHDECEVSDCSGRGHCQDGKCICMQGFAGEFCEKGKLVNNWSSVFVQTEILFINLVLLPFYCTLYIYYSGLS